MFGIAYLTKKTNDNGAAPNGEERRDQEARKARNIERLEIPESFHEARRNLSKVCDEIIFKPEEKTKQQVS